MSKKPKNLKTKVNKQPPQNIYSNNISFEIKFTKPNEQEKFSSATVRSFVVMEEDIYRRLKIFLAKN